MAAEQDRHAPPAVAVQRRQAGVRGGADRIVDPGQAITFAQPLQAVRQRAEIQRRRCQRCRIQAQRLDRRQHRAQVAAVVAPGQRHRRGVEHERVAAIQRIATQVPAIVAVEPDDATVRQVQPGQARIGCVEHGGAGPGGGHQRQLVLDVALLAAMPVQVLGEQVQHHRHLRAHAAGGDVAGLVAGQFDRVELRHAAVGRGFRQLQQRQADVAGQRGAMAAGAQQVRQQRGGGALALGAGHAHGARLPMG